MRTTAVTWVSLYVVLVLLVALALPGCGGRGSGQPELRQDAPAGTAGLLPLPSPAELRSQQAKHSSLLDSALLKSGAAFGAALPHGNVAADGDYAEFTPSWDPGGAHAVGNLAYATYQFAALGYNGEPALYLGWLTPPTDFGNLWIGLANFTRNRWDWLPGPSGIKLTEPKLLTDYRAGDGTVYAVVLLLGTDPCSLNWIGLGAPAAAAQLVVTPESGPAPLSVDLDASGSFAPDGIVKYEWDFDGDGTYEQDTAAVPTVQHVYDAGGKYYPVVRVTSTGGNPDTAPALVTVYNETENNDDTAGANQLPSLTPVFTWYGSSGTGADYAGYDGDDFDYFTFSGSTGDSVSFTLTLDPIVGDLDLALLDSDGDTLDSSASSTSAVEVVSHTFAAADTAPFFVRVKKFKGYSEYTLSGGLGEPPTADLTAAPTDGATPLLVDFDASGSSDPDGFPIAKFEWDYDSDGTYDEDTGAVATVQHTYSLDGIYLATVRVTDASGFIAAASVTITAGDIPYDEREDNDVQAEANALPALPFNGYRGSGGSGASYTAYDGDRYDWFSFNANSGETFTFALHLTPANGNLDLALYDGAGTYKLGSSSTTAATEQLTYTVLPSDTGSFCLRVYAPTGYSDYTLDGIFGAAPLAALTANPSTGPLPLLVSFDASASADDGYITKYEWDFDGDGSYDQDTGGTSQVSHTYNDEGFFSPTVRVTDNSGLTDTASASVNAGMEYDEVENNDSAVDANLFPGFPFTSFGGSCSTGDGYPGYDGDDADFFEFFATTGQLVDLTVTLPPVHGDIDIELLDNTAKSLKKSTSTGVTERITYTFTASDTAPFYLRVYKYSGCSDYLVDGTLGNPPVAELIATPDLGPVPLDVDFNASGSSDDGTIVKFEWDFDGDGAYDQDTGTTPTTSYSYVDAGFYQAKVRVTDDDGYTSTAGAHIMAGVQYHEVEDNDAQGQANAFPAFPFTNRGGSSGTGAGYPGYDGDDNDYYSFSASLGQAVTLTMNLPPWHGDIDLELLDADGDSLKKSTSTSAVETINYTFVAGDTAPFYLRVYKYGKFSDYLLEGSIS